MVDATGKDKVPLDGDAIVHSLGYGLMKVEKDKCYLKDITGRILMSLEWDDRCEFKDGMIKVCKCTSSYKTDSDNPHCIISVPSNRTFRCGYIDKKGKVIVPFKYAYIGDFCEGYAKVNKGGTESFLGGAVIGGKWGFVDKKWKTVVPEKYDRCSDFKDGLANVMKDSKWGCVNVNGKEVVPLEYDECFDFEGGLARVKKNGKYGYVNTNGDIIVPVQYDWCSSFKNGFSMIIKGEERYDNGIIHNGKKGIVNKEGRILIQPIYDECSEYSDGLIKMEKNRYGCVEVKYFDEKGTAQLVLYQGDNLFLDDNVIFSPGL